MKPLRCQRQVSLEVWLKRCERALSGIKEWFFFFFFDIGLTYLKSNQTNPDERKSLSIQERDNCLSIK